MSSHPARYTLSKPIENIPSGVSQSLNEPTQSHEPGNIFDREDSLQMKNGSEITSMKVSDLEVPPVANNPHPPNFENADEEDYTIKQGGSLAVKIRISWLLMRKFIHFFVIK